MLFADRHNQKISSAQSELIALRRLRTQADDMTPSLYLLKAGLKEEAFANHPGSSSAEDIPAPISFPLQQ